MYDGAGFGWLFRDEKIQSERCSSACLGVYGDGTGTREVRLFGLARIMLPVDMKPCLFAVDLLSLTVTHDHFRKQPRWQGVLEGAQESSRMPPTVFKRRSVVGGPSRRLVPISSPPRGFGRLRAVMHGCARQGSRAPGGITSTAPRKLTRLRRIRRVSPGSYRTPAPSRAGLNLLEMAAGSHERSEVCPSKQDPRMP